MSDDQDAAEEALADQVWGRTGVDSYPEAADFLRRLAEARDEYSGPDIDLEYATLQWAAKALEGDREVLRAILPSWRWPEFGVELDVRVFPPKGD